MSEMSIFNRPRNSHARAYLDKFTRANGRKVSSELGRCRLTRTTSALRRRWTRQCRRLVVASCSRRRAAARRRPSPPCRWVCRSSARSSSASAECPASASWSSTSRRNRPVRWLSLIVLFTGAGRSGTLLQLAMFNHRPLRPMVTIGISIFGAALSRALISPFKAFPW